MVGVAACADPPAHALDVRGRPRFASELNEATAALQEQGGDSLGVIVR